MNDESATRDAGLRGSEGLLDRAFDGMPMAMVLVGAGGDIVLLNLQAEKMFGHSRRDLIGQPVERLVPQRFRGLHPGLFTEPHARAMGARRNLFGLRKHGGEFPVEIGLNPIETGQGPMVLSVIVDITERKRAEAALRESEESFRFMVEGVQDYGVFMLDADGRVASWNAGAERLLGYVADEVIGRDLSCFFQDEDVANGKPVQELAIAKSRGRYDDEGWRVRKDGSRLWANVVITAAYDAEGGLRGFSKVVRDITARQRMERRFQQVVESSPSAMVMINGDGRIEMVNAQAGKVFGYGRDDLVGQPVDLLVPPRFRGEFFTDPPARPTGAARELLGLRKDGSEFPIEIGLNPIETGEGSMLLSVIVDITERKQREERISAALKEKELLLGEIHHRVKNNLQVIHSLLDLQALGIDDPRMHEMVRDSQARVRAMSLIHQTLYQSKDFANVDFQHFLDSLLPALMDAHGMAARGISLLADAGGVQVPINMAIPCGLVVSELVTNSLKHAFPGGASGTIGVSLRKLPDGMICLAVQNDGEPIPADVDIERAGSLGLRLVALLSEQLHGRLEIRRANPTRFTLYFPVGEVNK
jgi:PAS domain S-box-containing protein